VKDSKPAEEKDHPQAGEIQYWLMKAEPETRIVKGKVCPLRNVLSKSGCQIQYRRPAAYEVTLPIATLTFSVSPWDGVVRLY
jgi:hypothetical protein